VLPTCSRRVTSVGVFPVSMAASASYRAGSVGKALSRPAPRLSHRCVLAASRAPASPTSHHPHSVGAYHSPETLPSAPVLVHRRPQQERRQGHTSHGIRADKRHDLDEKRQGMTGPRVPPTGPRLPQDHTRSQHRPYVYTGREGRAARPQLDAGRNIRRTEQTVEGDHREHRPCHEVEVVGSAP